MFRKEDRNSSIETIGDDEYNLIKLKESLYKALCQNKLLGAAIDVWYQYSPEEDENGAKFPFHYPFNTLDNIILSPHRAASPFSDLKRWNEVIENIKRFNQGRNDFLNVVELDREY